MKREAPIYRTPREKFERAMDHEQRWAVEHHAKVRFDGRYRAVCSCGWMGKFRDERSDASYEIQEHHAETARPDLRGSS